MKGDGDKFIDDMLSILPIDIITYIIRKFIYLPENIELIGYQKKLHQLMLRQLNIISNIIHIDDNCCVYINNNDIIICNNTDARLITPQRYMPNTNITYHYNNMHVSEEEQPVTAYNQTLLAQINSNLEVINRSLPSLYTSNMVIQNTHEDMDDVIFYIIYV